MSVAVFFKSPWKSNTKRMRSGNSKSATVFSQQPSWGGLSTFLFAEADDKDVTSAICDGAHLSVEN